MSKERVAMIVAAGAMEAMTVGSPTIEHIANAAQQPQGIVRHGEFGQGYQGPRFIVPGTETHQSPRDQRSIDRIQEQSGEQEVRCPTTAKEAVGQIVQNSHSDKLIDEDWKVYPTVGGSSVTYQGPARFFRTRTEWAKSDVYIIETDPITGKPYYLGSFNGNNGVNFSLRYFILSCHNRAVAAAPTSTPIPWNPPALEPWAATPTPTPTPGANIIVAPGAGQPPLP